MNQQQQWLNSQMQGQRPQYPPQMNQQQQQQFFRPQGLPLTPQQQQAMYGQRPQISPQMIQQGLAMQQQYPQNPQQQQLLLQQQNMIAQQSQLKRPSEQNPPVAPRIKKRKPTDKTLSRKVESYVPESRLFSQLQDFERQLDATIVRRKVELLDNPAKLSKVTRTLRIFVSNTAGSQYIPTNDAGEALFDADTAKSPNWTLKVEGRLLDVANKKYQTGVHHKFSYFVKSMVVELKRDSNLYSEGNIIEWQKNPSAPEMDGFEVKRKGDSELPCRIIITLDQPDKFKLPAEMARLLDIHTDNRQNIMLGLWQYIKHHKLQDPEDRKKLNPDEGLRLALNLPDSGIPFSILPSLIDSRLLPIDPIVINYTIKVDKEFSFSPTAFDVEVEFTDQSRKNVVAAITQGAPNVEKEIAALDEKMSHLVAQVGACNVKRDFLLGFVKDPISFLNTWVASQSRDLEVVLGDQRLVGEEVRRSEFYKQAWVSDSVGHFLTDRFGAIR
ncbi:hypothetical protein SmJEL517_g04788 [Synchytrium microbalum]|uniref:DM2 domain-containing protein n=1 Tax=Synchytrium microbalum TaxID=1806994 RepID=A0A507BXB7_9FUNG|nr:uncharacterized protein SmJEL517_g04788 [Synchytrium microbalum]TPX32072.1 hypothetical protein SmJEL517_g04788 [Synchytrium microbalum]